MARPNKTVPVVETKPVQIAFDLSAVKPFTYSELTKQLQNIHDALPESARPAFLLSAAQNKARGDLAKANRNSTNQDFDCWLNEAVEAGQEIKSGPRKGKLTKGTEADLYMNVDGGGAGRISFTAEGFDRVFTDENIAAMKELRKGMKTRKIVAK